MLGITGPQELPLPCSSSFGGTQASSGDSLLFPLSCDMERRILASFYPPLEVMTQTWEPRSSGTGLQQTLVPFGTQSPPLPPVSQLHSTTDPPGPGAADKSQFLALPQPLPG